MDNSKIAARVIILPEVLNDKTNTKMDLKEYYGDWYSFDGKELDVSFYSESYLDKEKTKKEIIDVNSVIKYLNNIENLITNRNGQFFPKKELLSLQKNVSLKK